MFRNNIQALQKFKRNYWGVCSLFYIILLFVISIFAYILAPDNSQNANNGDISLRALDPGTTITMIQIENSKTSSLAEYFTGKKHTDTYIPILSHRISNDSLFYYTYTTDSKLSQEIYLNFDSYSSQNYKIIEKKFWLGTDNQGRDYLSRLLIGSRISLTIGFVAVALSLIVSVTLGDNASYFGGKFETSMLRLIYIVRHIPTLLLFTDMPYPQTNNSWKESMSKGSTILFDLRRLMRGQIIIVMAVAFLAH